MTNFGTASAETLFNERTDECIWRCLHFVSQHCVSFVDIDLGPSDGQAIAGGVMAQAGDSQPAATDGGAELLSKSPVGGNFGDLLYGAYVSSTDCTSSRVAREST